MEGQWFALCVDGEIFWGTLEGDAVGDSPSREKLLLGLKGLGFGRHLEARGESSLPALIPDEALTSQGFAACLLFRLSDHHM